MLKSKSANFERNLNSKKMSSQIDKNSYKIVNIIATSAKQNFIPVATRATFNSIKISKSKNGYEISSFNYQDVANSGVDRYNYKKPNKAYATKSGNIIPAGKNAGRFQWFKKAYKLQKTNIDKIAKGGVVK
jgi:hypothetical protein